MPAKSKKRTSKVPDAIALLKGDHRKVAGLFKKFKEARDHLTLVSKKSKEPVLVAAAKSFEDYLS